MRFHPTWIILEGNEQKPAAAILKCLDQLHIIAAEEQSNPLEVAGSLLHLLNVTFYLLTAVLYLLTVNLYLPTVILYLVTVILSLD